MFEKHKFTNRGRESEKLFIMLHVYLMGIFSEFGMQLRLLLSATKLHVDIRKL